MSSSLATRRYAAAIASSTVRMSCSRETCFSALSWSRAPTKSRLMSSLPPLRHCQWPRAAEKNTWGSPTSEAAIHARRSIHRGLPSVDRSEDGPSQRPKRRARSGRRRDLAVAVLDVALEDADELVDEAVAAERPVELAIDEHGRHRLL